MSYSPFIVHRTTGVIGDTGVILNANDTSSIYTNGLAGVDQNGNWLVTNISACTFFTFVLLLVAYRVAHLAKAQLRLVVSLHRDSDQRYWMQNTSQLWTTLKRHLIYAPLSRARHNREIQLSSAVTMGTLPGRLHTILLVLYVLSNLVYCLALHWSADAMAITAELRGRTGQLATLNLIPTILFALRNNPLLWLTGVSYDTFNLFHRWAARIVVLEAVVHTLCWAANNLRSGGQDQVNAGLSTSISFQWGMVATVIFCLIAIIALSPIRHAAYETFVHSHRLFAMIGLAGVYIHIDRAHLPQLGYIQFIFILYITELLIRYGRIWYHNISRKAGFTEVIVEALPADACRVTFKLRRPWFYRPGCHTYVHIPTMAFFSSHPFSIAWTEKAPLADARMTMELEKMPYSTKPRFSEVPAPLNITKFSIGSVVDIHESVSQISLICRARSGFTRHLYDKAMRSQGKRFATWGFIEGPYGGYDTFESYGTVVLFAGGVGITHCIGHVRHLLKQHEAGMCATQRILLVWSVPTTECLEWVRVWTDEILRMKGRRDVLRIHLYVTKPRHRGEVVSSTGTVQMFPGRCNPKLLLAREMEDRIGAMAVTVCGPGAFADSVRAAARDVVEDGSVDLVEEAFSY